MPIMDKKLLDIIVCPISKEKMSFDEKRNELISKKAKLAYKVKEIVLITFGLALIQTINFLASTA